MTSLSHRRSVEGHSSDMSDAYEGNECRLDIPLSTQSFPGSVLFWCGQALLTFSSVLYFNLSLLCHLQSWFCLPTDEFKAEVKMHINVLNLSHALLQRNLSEELSSLKQTC